MAGHEVIESFIADVTRMRDETREVLVARIAELEAGPVKEWQELRSSLDALEHLYAGERPPPARVAEVKPGSAVAKRAPQASRSERMQALEELVRREPGITGQQAAARLGISNGYISNLAKALRVDGRLGPGPQLVPAGS